MRITDLDSTRVRGLGLIALLLLGIVVGTGRGPTPLAAQSAVQLQPRWNLVAAPASGAVASVFGEAAVSVHRWDGVAEAFESWRRGVPAAANGLATVAAGEGMWVEVEAPVALGLPPLAAVRVGAGEGWVLVGWTQARAEAAEVLVALGARRIVGWEAGGQSFVSFDAEAPAAVNTLAVVERGQAVWALLGAAPPPEPASEPLAPVLAGRGIEGPIELGAYPGERLFVAELGGRVRVFDEEGGDGGMLLDLRSRVSRGGEQGLLSLALAPDFGATGYLFVYYTTTDPSDDEEIVSRLSRFTVVADRASLSSELVILEVAQPFGNHNGGAVRFGPDGMLYLGLGDGGAGGDPRGNGQDRSTLLGSILRIDVSASSAGQRYRVPADNPFLGVMGAREEIYAYGLRNPWRMAFDAEGRLWAGDVGQETVEEINVVVAGGNYGWNRLEGENCFLTEECSSGGTVLPAVGYGHAAGNCSVTGGVVYGGTAVPRLSGRYVYGDFCSGRIWSVAASDPGLPRLEFATDLSIASFGVDASGEIYVLSLDGRIVRIAE